MKKMLLVAVLVICSPLCISAAAEPEASFPEQSDYDIQGTMKHMTTQELGRLAQTSRRMHDLAQPELAKRKEHAIMMRQRAEFKKRLSVSQGLDLRDLEITHLFPGVFDDKAFAHITTLLLSNNQLTVVPQDAFNGLVKLKRLFLSRNQLTTISTSAFDKLKELNLLDLRNNQLAEPTKEALRKYFAKRPNLKLYL